MAGLRHHLPGEGQRAVGDGQFGQPVVRLDLGKLVVQRVLDRRVLKMSQETPRFRQLSFSSQAEGVGFEPTMHLRA